MIARPPARKYRCSPWGVATVSVSGQSAPCAVADDPDRADTTDAAIIAETVSSLDRHDIETLRDSGDGGDQTATAYYAVLDNAADACRLAR